MMSTRTRSRVLVTGGAGFVGRHLVDALADRGHAVTALDLASTPWRDDVTFVGVDLRDREATRRAVAGHDVVFHNASLVHTKHNRVADVWAVNHGGTQAVLAGCRAEGVRRLIYVSSATVVYQGRDIRGGDESLPYSSKSLAPYADSKIAAEKLVLGANGPELLTCALRPHVVFGPGDTRLLPAIIRRAQQGRWNFRIGWGEKLSDFTYVGDLVQALLLAEERLLPGSETAGQAYFITTGQPYPFFRFVSEMLAALGLPPQSGVLPGWLAYGAAAVVEGLDTLKGGTLNAESGLTRFAIRYLCTHHYFSIARARRELGYAPQVSIAEGIRLTAASMKQTGPIPIVP